ncbi:serine/threonine protein kinase [Candidatus Woesearchaeota archaeon]|nr:serine/threonine protein kinase [Candidatus Woesearchaeota archaeon]
MIEDILKKEDKLSPGRVLGDRYKIIEEIGRGGMAHVYSAHDKKLKRVVALKVLDKKFYMDEEYVKRFKREAESIARLDHPNIADVYDIDELDNRLYISMKYIEGKSLDKIIEKHKGFFDKETVCKVGQKLLDALAYAHIQGIIHRDIKPSNVMITGDVGLTGKWDLKILDFGIAKIVDDETIHTQLTQYDTRLGTPEYMSPEQIDGEETTGKEDVWSTSVVLYEMLTNGRLPFGIVREMKYTKKTKQIAVGQLKGPRSINSQIPKNLEDIILKGLEREIDKRYDAKEMLEDINKSLNQEKFVVNGSKERRAEVYGKKRGLKLAIGVGILSVLLATGGWFWINRYKDIGSLMPVVKEMEKAEINNMEEIVPYLKNYYPRLSKRLEWFFNKDFSKRIEKERLRIEKEKQEPGKKSPEIYPVGTYTADGYLGKFIYLTGESTTAGEIVPFLYYLYDDTTRRAKNEKDAGKRSKFERKGKEILDDIMFCASNLYFAEYSDTASGSSISDRTALAVHRFHPPCAEFVQSLKKDHPLIYNERKDEIKQIVDNHAKAIKMAVEYTLRNTIQKIKTFRVDDVRNNPSTWNDSEFALLLCDGFRLHDVQSQVLSSYDYLGNKTSNMYEFLELIINEAKIKFDKLAMQESWRQIASNNEYFGFMKGHVHRKKLIQDLKTGEETKFGNNEIFQRNLENLFNSSNMSRSEFLNYLSKIEKRLNQEIQMLGEFGIRQAFDSPKPSYFLIERNGNPLSIYHLGYLLGLNAVYDKPDYRGIRKDDVDSYIFKTILTRNHVVKNLGRFRGFFKNTIPWIDHEGSIGGTNIAFGRSIYKRIRGIAYEGY